MIQTAKHPNFKEINPILEQWINFLPQMEADSYTNLVAAKRTSYNCYPQPFMDLGNWVAKTFNFQYDWDTAEIELWGAIYNKGHYALKHRHGDPDDPEKRVVSFVYYVNAPEGSSPLVFLILIRVMKQKMVFVSTGMMMRNMRFPKINVIIE